ncbi:MAG TPA: hypothetical protein VEZ42_04680 [Pseudonocardia sp.]|nr:hypothetical protein [Pseudonocardia sp.]
MAYRVPGTDALSGLDALLAEPPEALGTLVGALPAPLLRMAASLAGRPLAVGRRGAGLAAELLRIGLGRSELPVGPRHPDPAWAENALLRRLVQAHLATRTAAAGLLDDAALPPTDRQHLATALDLLADALAPGGTPPRPVPARPGVEVGVEVGVDVATTPGAVVLRTPAFELIQYLPRGEAVRQLPVLVVPPLANRFYLLDLGSRRSVVDHLVRGGQQVFLVSWRNPDAGSARQGLDDHARAVLDALDACERITRTATTSVLGVGSGATVAAVLLGHLAAVGAVGRAASLTLALAALSPPDRSGPEPPARPPAADLLGWAADTVRVPAALHADLTALAAHDALAHAGAVRVLGTPVDLTKVDCDTYVVAGDHGGAAAGYRSGQLLGGECRFALAPGGPVDALLTPPGGAADDYRAGRVGTADLGRWVEQTPVTSGSWWTDHLDWLAARSGPWVDAPPELGGRGLHAIAPTPGEYVLAP